MNYTKDKLKIAPIVLFADHAGNKSSAGVYVGNAHHVTFLLMGGTQTDGDAQVKIETGTAHATMTGVVQGEVYMTGAAGEAVGGDAWSAVAHVANEDYFLIPDDNSRSYMIEVDISKVTNGHSWIRVDIVGGARTDLCCFALVYCRFSPSETVMRLA